MAGNAITVRILGVADGFKKAAKEVVDQTEQMAKRVGAAGKGMGAVFGGLQLDRLASAVTAQIGPLVDLGRQLDTAASKSKTVFGPEALSGVEEWADKSAHAMGLTERGAVSLAANFADLLIPMGFTQKQAGDMSTKVLGLSGALAAWTGGTKDAAEVNDILAKAMLGERDGLKDLGISISEADVSARLLAKGQDKLTGSALEQAKAVATSELIFEKSKDAQAAFADGTKTSAEKALEAKGRLGELKDTIALGLVPVVDKLTSAGLGVLTWFQELSPAGQKVVGVIAALVVGALAITKAVKAWTAVQGAFNIVMAANPIVLVVIAIAALVAAVVLAYKHSDTFRAIVDAAFRAVADAGKWMWENVLKPVFGFLADAFHVVAGVASWFWSNIIEPQFKAFGAIASWLWSNAIGPAFGAIAEQFRVVAGVASWLWEHALQPVFSKIGDAAAAVADGIAAGFRVMAGIVKGIINGLIGWVNKGIDALNLLPGDDIKHIGLIGDEPTRGGGGGMVHQLASGGIVKARRGGTLALLGEGGRDEAVVPLGRGGSGVGPTYTFNITLNGIVDAASARRAVVDVLEDHFSLGGNITNKRGGQVQIA